MSKPVSFDESFKSLSVVKWDRQKNSNILYTKNASLAVNKIVPVYGSDTMSIRTAQRWFQLFRSVVETIKDAPRSGRYVVQHVNKIMDMVKADQVN